jgi:hypothetical protein
MVRNSVFMGAVMPHSAFFGQEVVDLRIGGSQPEKSGQFLRET